MTEEKVLPVPDQTALVLKGYHHVELYVGNAKQAAHFYRTAFGLKLVAYSGLETGARNRVSYVLEENDARLVLTSSLYPDDEIAGHVRRHGDGVKDIAFIVDHAEDAFNEAVTRGARPVMEPALIEDDEGEIVKASIGVFGDTIHSFIERKDYAGKFLPGFRAVDNVPPPPFSTNLAEIDHLAISISEGQLDEWVGFYEETMGFHQSHREDVATEYSAMNSKVVQNQSGQIKFPLVEPAVGKRKSQIQEYLEYYDGPGVQHVAFLSSDIVDTVKAWRAAGNEFLKVPNAYYEMLEERVGRIDEDVEELQAEHILVDRDQWGYLMQIFTRPVQSRPTVFMEAIQRRGARGFGSGNIKALFTALELDQAKRGNL
ncbi:MAG TPA: 4-hydroxyphenylpyruvate dioxygenase [Pyrinomonadaceae bacterium]|nr:4-hydroxyphenylpyruvate dioxygenase [Pyrinomonadaceae bacterium]